MKSSKTRELQLFNSRQSKRSRKTYQGLLVALCQEYEHLPAFSRALGFLRANDDVGLVSHADWMDEQQYSSKTLHFVSNQLAALIRKYPLHNLDLDIEEVARNKFMKAEHRCHRINQRFLCFYGRSPYESSLSRMRSFISYVLGEDVPLQKVWERCGFGPGASIGVHGNATNVARKIESNWSVTPQAYVYALAATRYDPILREYLLLGEGHNQYCDDPLLYAERYSRKVSIVEHNNISFVPKTAKTKRTIAVEPLLNGFLQKGVDLLMRERLKRIGIDLSDQSRNSEFARLGSLDDSEEGFVTIDLSSASDSIAREVVRYLLPVTWYEFLDSIRSKNFKLHGKTFPYHKFCSMGNGFCFPLETLLFTAACHSVGCGVPGRDFLVYGDDIIIRKKYAESLLHLLGVLGFTVNTRKTFLQGPFRESCGGNWFRGEDVSPYTLDEQLDSLQSLFKAHNLTMRNSLCYEFFRTWRQNVFALVPPKLNFVQPYGQPDSAFTVEYDMLMTSKHARWLPSEQRWCWLALATNPKKDIVANRDARSSVRMYALLRGSRSEAMFTVRQKPNTKVLRK